MARITTGDGSHSFRSEHFDATYHSPFGAVTESAHVFIAAGLQFLAEKKQVMHLFEMGFGSGLNAFMTWLEAERRQLQVHYLALEAYPLSLEAAAQSNYPIVLGVPDRRSDFQRLHQADWNTEVTYSPHFHLEKRLGRLENLPLPAATLDLIYFDAFDPQVQPELWSTAIFANLYQALRPGGVLVTYCAQGQFRRVLRSAGFQVEKLPGVLGKWEMTRAVKE